MNYKVIFRYLLIVVFVVLVSSCMKSKQDKLIGTWINQPMTNTTVETDDEQLWTFDASSKLKVEDIRTDSTYVYEGTYFMSSKNMGMSGYFIQITNVSSLLDGRYQIKQLDGTKLSLHRIELANGNTTGAFLWRDFLKK